MDGYERSIAGAVDMLIQHRKANPRVFPVGEFRHFSPALVKQEFLRHLKEKAPHVIADEPVPAMTRTETGMPQTCTCGGAEFEPHQCPTCGGSRIDGYKCVKCGRITGL